jgi:hypothetical protein
MPKQNPTASNGGGGPLAGIRARIAGGSVKPTYKTGTLAEPTSGVRVKPPARTVGAPSNETKDLEKLYSTVSRGAGPGNKRMGRVATSNNPTASGKASAPVESPKGSNPNTVKINSSNFQPRIGGHAN